MSAPGEIAVTLTNGVLKPDSPLNFPEGSRFRALIRPLPPDPEAAARAIDTIRKFRESGAFRSGGRKFTREEMHERD